MTKAVRYRRFPLYEVEPTRFRQAFVAMDAAGEQTQSAGAGTTGGESRTSFTNTAQATAVPARSAASTDLGSRLMHPSTKQARINATVSLAARPSYRRR